MPKNALSTVIWGIGAAIKRFPVPTLFSILFCIIALGGFAKYPLKDTYLSILFCGFFWFIALKLYAESRQWSLIRYYALSIAIFLLIAWHFYTAEDVSAIFSFLGAALFLSIFIAPFLTKHASSLHVWSFNYRLWMHICFTILAAIVLYLGLAAIVASLNFLFGINSHRNLYADIWLVVATLFSPILAMSGIPRTFTEEDKEYPKTIRLILSYIALPLLFIYAAILYAYIAKILLTTELPKGGVAYLVSGFGCAGIIAYLASYPLHRHPGIIGLFSRYFFLLLLAPLGLFAMGIGVRIHEYGITEERYAILLCLIWLALSAGFALVKYSQEAPKKILISIIILLIAASFGPWSAANISTWSQVERLKTLLAQHHMLVNGRIQPPVQTVSRTDRAHISSITDYIASTHKARRLRPLFEHVPDAHVFTEQQYYSAPAIVQDMGIGYIAYYDSNETYDTYTFDYNSDFWDVRSIRISGYDYLVEVSTYNLNHSGAKGIALDKEDPELKVFVSFDNNTLVYHVTFQGEAFQFPLEPLIQRLEQKKAHNQPTDLQDFSLEQTSGDVRVQLILNVLTGKFVEGSNKPTIGNLETILFLEKK